MAYKTESVISAAVATVVTGYIVLILLFLNKIIIIFFKPEQNKIHNIPESPSLKVKRHRRESNILVPPIVPRSSVTSVNGEYQALVGRRGTNASHLNELRNGGRMSTPDIRVLDICKKSCERLLRSSSNMHEDKGTRMKDSNKSQRLRSQKRCNSSYL